MPSQAGAGLPALVPARLFTVRGRGIVIVWHQGTNGPSFRLIGIQADDNIGEAFHEILVMQHTDDRAGLPGGFVAEGFPGHGM